MTFLRLALFHARQLLRTGFFVQTAVAAPVSFALLRALGVLGAEQPMPTTLWVDAAVAGIWATTTTAVGIVGFQRFQGTLEQLAFSVIRPGVVFGSLTAAASVIGVIGVPLAIAVQLMVAGQLTLGVPQALGYLVAVLACAASAGVLAAAFVFSRAATAFEPLLLMPIWLLAGIVVPLTSMPSWLQPVALVHPLTAAAQATRQTDLVAAVPWLALSVGTSLGWYLIAAVALGRALRAARTHGTLGLS